MQSLLFSTLALFVALFSNQAQASFIEADLPSPTVNISVGTHVVIAGQGLEDGFNWLEAAQTQALAYRSHSSHGPIHLITAVDDSKRAEYLDMISKWGYVNIRYQATDLTADQVIEILSQLSLVASLDFFGHDGAFLGLALEDENSNHRFYLKDVDHMAGQVHFSKDAFIRLLGCNTGWFLAPYMAKKLGVPTAGTLTSTDIETLSSENIWFFDETRTYPAGVGHANANSVSYSEPVPCIHNGGCVRMHPINSSYYGKHGVYTGALPFVKFFCGTADRLDCFRRMALSTEFLVGVQSLENAAGSTAPSLIDFAENLAEQFCPPEVNQTVRQACLQGVVGHVTGVQKLSPNFTTLPNGVTQLECTFSSCTFQTARDQTGQKILESTVATASTAFVDELGAYILGYQKLRN